MKYRCKTCKELKIDEEFGVNSSNRRYLHCKDCRRAKSRQRKYGLSAEEQLQMLRNQGNRCLLCQTPQTLRNIHIDHDHKTGKVRGLLCSSCNHYLHAVEELGMAWVKRATQYLLGRYD